MTALAHILSLPGLLIPDYSPARHDLGGDLGQPYDWSGISHEPRWATMIAPSFAITCDHWPATSVLGVPVRVSWTFADLRLLYLESPLPVVTYPLGVPSVGLPVLMVGQPGVVGASDVLAVGPTVWLPYRDLPDYALAEEGDSGGPTMAIMQSGCTLAVLGVHQRLYATMDGFGTVDTSLWYYRVQIREILASYGESVELVGPYMPGDANGDGLVDLQDFGILKSWYGTSESAADFNFDGVVDLQDFGILKAALGAGMVPHMVPGPWPWLVMLAIGRRRQ